MTRYELRSTVALAVVLVTRLLGLFMIYPVFTGYASHLLRATPAMIGIALGAYGLTQGLLQIPYGLVSDHVGRRTTIAVGLLLFALGSVVAALSDSIEGAIIGRTLQGTGAIGSVVLATIADITREEVRTRAMAFVGMTIGLSFVVAIVLGPVFAGTIGVPGIYWLTAALALFGIVITFALVPSQVHVRYHPGTMRNSPLKDVVGNAQLFRLDLCIFILHLILTANFLAIPLVLLHALHIPVGRDWIVYLPVLAISIVLMVPAIFMTDKKGGNSKDTLLATIVLLAVSQLGLLFWPSDPIVVSVALVALFAGFNIMEALLPSLLTKVAPPSAKGTAAGVFSSAQFVGIFAGGALGGLANAENGPTGIFALTLIATLIWFVIATTLRLPGRSSNFSMRIGNRRKCEIADPIPRLKSSSGTADAVADEDARITVGQVDKKRSDLDDAARIMGI
jgi:predicted MFS family arabinose efflux permease